MDLVQLEKSGAGLPSHAGKEAALHDGAGNQILGRTAVRHWLDPDPVAAVANAGSPFAENFEFSTYGDATQAALETAGWTFSNCTASVTNGSLQIVSSGSNDVRAIRTVSLSGDFDFVTRIFSVPTTPAATYDYTCGIVVGIPGPTDVGHYVLQINAGTHMLVARRLAAVYDGNAFGAGGTTTGMYLTGTGVERLCRYSGTVYGLGTEHMYLSWNLGTSAASEGTWNGSTAVDSSTFTRVGFVFDATTSGQTFQIPFLRRYK